MEARQMYSIKIDIDDTIFDKVMFFLNNIPKKNIEVKKLDSSEPLHSEKMGDFFTKSPLRGEVQITRDLQTYDDRVKL
ncbi:MAG: hypothetical protein ACOCP1_02205 [Campylobacterales bacterium]